MQQIQLAIPAPCHEHWDNMVPAEKGRFCNACARQVVDFSVMSDAQVLSYFSGLKDHSVCGRAYPDQLNRAIAAPAPPTKIKWYWNYLALFLLFFSKPGETKAQKGKIAIQQPVQLPNQNTAVEVGEMAIAVPRHAISGKVLDASGYPVQGATISIAGTGRKFISGKDGGFVFLISSNERKLSVSAIGFKNKMISITNSTNYSIKLESEALRGEVTVTAGMMIVSPVPAKKKKN